MDYVCMPEVLVYSASVVKLNISCVSINISMDSFGRTTNKLIDKTVLILLKKMRQLLFLVAYFR